MTTVDHSSRVGAPPTAAGVAATARAAAAAAPAFGDPAYARFATEFVGRMAARWSELVAANQADLARARERGASTARQDRMTLAPVDLELMTDFAHAVAAEQRSGPRRPPERSGPHGVTVRRVPRPLGVLLVVYEGRPTVTVETALIAVAAGNAVILRGSGEVAGTDAALGDIAAEALGAAGLPPGLVQMVAETGRGRLRGLLDHDREIDLLVARGGPGLLEYVRRHSRIPVLPAGGGVNHLYVHHDADLELAARCAVDSAVLEPTGCTAAEMLLVDEPVFAAFAARLGQEVAARGATLTVRVPQEHASLVPPATGLTVQPLRDYDDGREFLDQVVGLRPVSGLSAATVHIGQYGSGHTEGVVSSSTEAVEAFCRVVDTAAVVVNGALLLHDGPCMGLGAELAVSTGRLHARGPVTIDSLVAWTWVVDASLATGTGPVLPAKYLEPHSRRTDMTEPAEQLHDRVGRVVRQILVREARVPVPPEEVGDDEPLNGDMLRVNSLAFVGVLVEFEEELGIEFPDDLFEGRIFDTVGDLVASLVQICMADRAEVAS